MEQPEPFRTSSKIAVAAAGILLVTVVMLMVFGDRQWKGLETLLTASMLVPLATVSWPLVELGGNKVLFGIDEARQAIWRRQQKELAAAREAGHKEGYQEGYDAGVAAQRSNGNGGNGNGHSRRRRRALRDDR